METLLVRLKPYDPRQRHTLRRFSFAGIVIFEERGWYRVTKRVGEALRGARQLAYDEFSPYAFDVCTAAEATAIDAREKHDSVSRRQSTDNLPLIVGRDEDRRAATEAQRVRARRGRVRAGEERA